MERLGKELLINLQKKYKSDRAIGDIYNMSRQAIYKLRKKYNISAYGDINKERNREIINLIKDGIQREKIAVMFNLSLSQINKIIKPIKKSKINMSDILVFKDSKELKEYVKLLKESGKKIVTTNGCFDILHAGHLQYLLEASKEGDALIIGINSDASVKRLKGESRPIQNEDDRAILISALKPVTCSFIFEEDTPDNFLTIVKPNIHVKGGDYKIEDLPEAKIVKKNGGTIKILSLKDGYSTTNILKNI